jgi:hypothetical protein
VKALLLVITDCVSRTNTLGLIELYIEQLKLDTVFTFTVLVNVLSEMTVVIRPFRDLNVPDISLTNALNKMLSTKQYRVITHVAFVQLPL